MRFNGAVMKTVSFMAFIVSLFFAYAVEAAEDIPVYKLYVSFDVKQNLLKGISTITLTGKREINVSTNNLNIMSIRLNGLPLQPEIKEGMFKVKGKGTIEITYEGVFREEYEKENPENIGVVSRNIISSRGIYLTDGWYPSLDGMAYYSLKAFLPKGFVAISEANEIKVLDKGQEREYSFIFLHPVNKINLVAGRYKELKETFHGIDIYGYFFPQDISLAKPYIEYSKKYIEMYEKLLSPYPYKRFSVVENFLETGYSMPTFTLLGKEVVRLPFIVRTSLGHEILHQWFGDSVYVNYREGNWTEGLTTYLSDHLYEEQKGEGWQYRKKILTDYESYVNPENEFPVKNFISRVDFASKAIGYGKGAMLFHMLKNLIGDDNFYLALKGLIKEKKFQEASWDDIKAAFEKASGKDLEWFFNQWLTRKGVISLEIRNPTVDVLKDVPTISFEVVQKGEPYEFDLPVKIDTGKGVITKVINIKKEKEIFEIPISGIPSKIILDDGYDLMRRLSEEEYPPVISRLLGDAKRLIVVPEKDGEKYSDFINVLKESGFTLKEEKEIRDEDIMTSSLLVCGFESPVLKRLFGMVKAPESGFTFMVKENPLNISKVIGIAYGDSKEEIDPVSKKIFHYGKYSFIRFEKGKNIEKKTNETKKGIKINLYEPVIGIQPQKTMKLDEIINNISNKPIIYVGERHTNYEDHMVQLKILMDLYERGRKFAIGMEMFQKPFQKVINDYISGSINEREFLKKSEYFKRWKYDYRLYREIMEFAKARNIPVVAINLRSEIIEKVSKGGLDVLTDEEKKEIPEDMDMLDEDYKRRLKEIFEQHKKSDSKNFDYFYQSQVLWDETMAHSIDEFLKENPDYQIVVLAGVGHIMYYSGIPKRAYRLNSKDYTTIIPDSETIDKDVGDYVLYPKSVSLPPALKLGVFLKEEDNRVKIGEILPGSVAEKAGFKEEDILVSMDDWKIKDVEDVRIFLVDKKQGETIKIKILRKRFLFGDRVFEINVTL
ncbi:MAG: ChaN family lipoprotein [Nitrospirota bacterium]